MSAKHSPLPWNVESPYREGGTFIAGPNTGLIARFYRPDHPATADANAEFVARAVNCHADLLAVCEALMKAEDMQQGARGGYTMGSISVAIDKARAAIAKAKEVQS